MEKEDISPFLNPLSIRHLLLNQIKEPVVLKGYLNLISRKEKWKCLKWTKDNWLKLLKDDPLNVRFGKKVQEAEVLSSPQWEASCYKDEMKYEDLLLWEAQEKLLVTSTKSKITSDKYWAYFDYFYMKNLVNIKLANEIISWEELGFPEVKAKDCTLWIGTSGANTPCHIDTYGCNIVCQIFGKKQWILFPKNQSQYLYPTRIPYEESSIYSKVGFPQPDINKHPKLSLTSPYVVTLEPGDVLFIPKQWWHFVKNLCFAISINSWLPLQTDHEDRLKEALVMYQIGSLCQSISSPTLLTYLFNWNMIDVSTMSSEELLQLIKNKVTDFDNEDKLIASKGNQISVPMSNAEDTLTLKCLKILNIHFVPKYTFRELLSLINLKHPTELCLENDSDSERDLFEILINSFTDDRVISVLTEVIKENLKK